MSESANERSAGPVGSAVIMPCPFCGHPRVGSGLEAQGPILVGLFIKHIECTVYDCGARGPRRWFAIDAIDAWNRRQPNTSREPRGSAQGAA